MADEYNRIQNTLLRSIIAFKNQMVMVAHNTWKYESQQVRLPQGTITHI